MHVPRYLSPDWCAEVSRRFLASALEEHRFGIMRTRLLGMPIAAMHENRGSYFDRAPAVMKALRAIYRGGTDPLAKLRRDVAAGTGWKAFLAREEGRPYATDMIGALFPGAGVSLHCDSPLLQADPFDARFPRQWSWNVYLSAADAGGELRVYRRLFAPQDRAYDRGVAGYSPDVVRGVARADFKPAQGSLILFNSAHFHEVLPVRGSAARINAHSWLRFAPDRRRFGIWS